MDFPSLIVLTICSRAKAGASRRAQSSQCSARDSARAGRARLLELQLFRVVHTAAPDYENFKEVKNLSCEILNFAILHECDWNTKMPVFAGWLFKLSPAQR
ncbi:hypothetical protein IMF23_15205 [Chelatococcus daeguensis]|uniref:hypothetical protein n=1 Tax=Chelatococcus TaxID=28209 RepID=UPI0011472979|nr:MULTISPECIES: hypothetical protein [Chelatococcus]MBM3084789.1 hypothetical protein [Chelatococcus daeguensis]